MISINFDSFFMIEVKKWTRDFTSFNLIMNLSRATNKTFTQIIK